MVENEALEQKGSVVRVYQKIETLLDRDEKTFKVLPGRYRLAEFLLIKEWRVTEKIDGMNIRIHLHSDGRVEYHGRTDKAELPLFLVQFLLGQLPSEVVRAAFASDTEAILYGEGYGEKIQSGGNYRLGVSFRLFDVVVLAVGRCWWLSWENIEDVAKKLGVRTVPVLARTASLDEAVTFALGHSLVAAEERQRQYPREGIVARTDPPLFTRRGDRLMWKLKQRDL